MTTLPPEMIERAKRGLYYSARRNRPYEKLSAYGLDLLTREATACLTAALGEEFVIVKKMTPEEFDRSISPEGFHELIDDLCDLDFDERAQEVLREAQRRIRELEAALPSNDGKGEA